MFKLSKLVDYYKIFRKDAKLYEDSVALISHLEEVIEQQGFGLYSLSTNFQNENSLIYSHLIGAIAANGGEVFISDELMEKIKEGGVSVDFDKARGGFILSLVDMDTKDEGCEACDCGGCDK